MNQVLGLYNYWIVIFLMMTGFYIVIARTNLIQKVIGLNIFQISVFLLYITMGKVTGGTAPILQEHDSQHAAEATADDHAQNHVKPFSNLAHLSPSLPGAEGLGVRGQQREPIPASELRIPNHVLAQHDDTTEKQDDNPEATLEPAESHTNEVIYTHPLPSVLMLTAIVVGVATTAVALALIIRIGEAYGTIEEDEILQLDRETT